MTLSGVDLVRLTKAAVADMKLSEQDADEALSIGYAVAVTALHQYSERPPIQHGQSASTWVVNQVKWGVLNFLKRADQRWIRNVKVMAEMSAAQQAFVDPIGDLERNRPYWEAFAKLDKREREVLAAIAVGFPWPQVCKRFHITGIDIQAIRDRVRALYRLENHKPVSG